jgi:hypothetical protein
VLELRMELQWQPVYNVVRYQVQVEKRVGNNYESYLTQTITDGVYTEWNGFEGVRYRARVRSITACGTEGSWSDWIYLSIGGEQEHPDEEEITIVGGPENPPGGPGNPPGGPGNPPGDPGNPPGQTTYTYWVTDQGNDNSREHGCENPGQGTVGTYLDLGQNICELATPPGTPIVPPQPFWDPFVGQLPN